MKIRNGFVSNSSSSSFIIDINAGDTDMNTIATGMFKIITDDFGEWAAPKKYRAKIIKKRKIVRANLTKALKRKDVIDGQIGIVMPSCNYETFIIQKDNKIYIATCNNHLWHDVISVRDIEYDEIQYEDFKKVMSDSFFFDVFNKMIHSTERFDDDDEIGESSDNRMKILYGAKTSAICPKCKKTPYSYVETVEGKKICSLCYKGIMGDSPRAIKEKYIQSINNKRKDFDNPIRNIEID